MLFAANIAVVQDFIVTVIKMGLFIFSLHASDVHQHTFNRSRAISLLY